MPNLNDDQRRKFFEDGMALLQKQGMSPDQAQTKLVEDLASIEGHSLRNPTSPLQSETNIDAALDKTNQKPKAPNQAEWNPWVGTMFGGPPMSQETKDLIATNLPRLESAGRDVRRMVVGAGLPMIGQGLAAGGALKQAAGAGLGSVANEAYDYLTSPPQERSGPVGMVIRPIANAALSGTATAISNKMRIASGPGGAGVPAPVEPPPVDMTQPPLPVAPVPRPMPGAPTPMEIPPKVSKDVAVGAGQALKDSVRDIAKNLPQEWHDKQALLKSLESANPEMVDVRPIVDKMKSIIPAGKATGDTAEDAARSYLNKKADELASEAAAAAIDSGIKYNPRNPALMMPLSRVNEYLTSLGRMGWKESGASLTRNAAKEVRGYFKQIEEEFVNRVHGPEALNKLKELNQSISSRLGVAEGVKKFMTKSPKGMVDAIKTNPDAADALEALDTRMNTGFLKSFREYHDSVARVDAARKALAEANKLSQKSFARTVGVVEKENKSMLGAYGKVVKGKNAAFVGEVKVAEAARNEAIKTAQAEYISAVKAADTAKDKALIGARMLSHLTGNIAGFFLGSELGIPGARWMGLYLGGKAGESFAPQMAKLLGVGARGVKIIAPSVIQGTRNIGVKTQQENP